MQYALFENLEQLFKQRTKLVESIGERAIQRAQKHQCMVPDEPDRILTVLLIEYNEIMLEIEAYLPDLDFIRKLEGAVRKGVREGSKNL